MSHDMKNMLKDTLILFVITLFAGLILGVVYQVTKEPIAAQKEKAKQDAYREVFTDAASFSDLEIDMLSEDEWNTLGYSSVDIEQVMKAVNDNNEEIGYVITITSHEGYSGDIRFIMGIRGDGTLNGISLLSISETAGLGMRAEEVLKPQFANKNVKKFDITKGAAEESYIDAISGATITTRAITDGVNTGLYYFQTRLLEGGNNNG